MAAIDFTKALDVKASEVKAVPLPPIGHYVFQVTGPGSINTDGRWQSVRFNVRGISVWEDADDVDADELREYGKPTSIVNNVAFMFDSEEGSEADLINMQNRVKKFAQHCGVEDIENKTLRQLVADCANKRFVGQIQHKQDKRDATGETMQAQIGRTAPVDAE